MAGTAPRDTVHLMVDELSTDPRLARRLPADLARRFRAVPLSEDGGRVTVAMADPDDAVAREAVASVLGPGLCVVQADPETIDTLVVEVWGVEAWSPVSVAVCSPPDHDKSDLADYAQSLAGLLGARLTHWPVPDVTCETAGPTRTIRHDLLITAESGLPPIHQILSSELRTSLATQPGGMPPAILIVRQPRWPLARILLLLCGEGRDAAAMRWVMRLARASGSAVTVLAVVPPTQASANARSSTAQGLPGLLSSETDVGRQMYSVARHLVNGAIQGILRLRQGPPERQIEHEVVDGDYDLIVVAAQPGEDWPPCLVADLSGSLQRWTERPILFAGVLTA